MTHKELEKLVHYQSLLITTLLWGMHGITSRHNYAFNAVQQSAEEGMKHEQATAIKNAESGSGRTRARRR